VRSAYLRFLPLFLWLLSPCIWGAVGGRANGYALQYDGQVGVHSFGSKGLAVDRHGLLFEDWEQNKAWSFRIAVRGTLSALEADELVIRDLYVQYKSGKFLVRAGNQQVIWGETFGAYYADIVNPKDYRQFGLLDLEYQRIPVPILNIKYIGSRSALQLIWIPKPSFNKLPGLSNDFFPSGLAGPDQAIVIGEEQSPELSLENSEAGLRLSQQVGTFDLSAFVFNGYDRMPNYRASILQMEPLTLRLDPVHDRMTSFGLTGTADLSEILLRWETVYTPKRGSGWETTWVLGADYTRLGPWNAAMQLSEIRQNTKSRELMLSVHGSGPTWGQQTLEATMGYVISDQGTLIQLKYVAPVSKRIELGMGADLLGGPGRSQLGQYSHGSRIFVLMRAFMGR